MKWGWRSLRLARTGSLPGGLTTGSSRGDEDGSGAGDVASADRCRDLRDWVGAGRHYRRALDRDPTLGPIWVQYGHALKEAGSIAEARRAYERAIAIDPTVADSYVQLGHALKLLGDMAGASSAYRKALARDPGSADAAAELTHLGDLNREPAPPPAGATGDGTTPIGDAQEERALRIALLARHDLLPPLLDRFDAAFYADTRQLGRDGADPLGLAALTHFCEVGLAECAPIADWLTFDPAFYAEAYGGGFAMSDVDAYRRWLNNGLATGQAPNMTVWLQDVQGVDLHRFDAVDIAHHRAANPDLAGRTDTQIIEHLLGGGLVDDGTPVMPNPDNAEVFVAAARRAAHRGAPDLSIRLLEALLAFVPDHPPALSDYADRLFDLGRRLAASQVYARLLDTGRGTRWTYHLLDRSYRAQRRFKDAVEVAGRGVAAFPQHDVMRREFNHALQQFYGACEADYWTCGRLGQMRAGQGAIDDYCRTAAASLGDARLPSRPIRAVALFGALDLPQCRFYRVDQKAEQLRHGGFETRIFDARTEAAAFLADINRFEAVIFYRVALFPDLLPVFAAARALGLVTFYDIDDLIFDRDHYPDSLESYGGQITRDQHIALGMGPPLFAGAMALCDYAIASTPTLAKAMAGIVATGRAFVHRNALGADHLRYLHHAPPSGADRPVTVFYGSGTRAHKEDFQDLVEPALIAVARRHGAGVTIVLVGWLPVSKALREAAPGLMLIEPSFDIHRYWDLLKEADINLAVLKPSLAVDCKSEIKWMEAAIFGIPSIVSRTATHAEVIREGETGFMCDTVAEWTQALDRLVGDRRLRRAVGAAARDAVQARYGRDTMAANLAGILTSVAPAAPAVPRPKILFVNVFYAPQKIGGATRVLHDNITRLRQVHGDAFDCEVFTVLDGRIDDYVVESYAEDGVRVTGVSRSSAGEESVADPRMADIFRRFLATSRPDIIHFHCVQRLSVAVVDVALDLGIPYLVTAHDAWWISGNQFVVDASGREQVYDYTNPLQTLACHGQAAFARAQALRPALLGAQRVLAVSRPFGDLYRRCGVPNVDTLANGVSALPPRPRTPAPDDRIRLGFVGGLSRHKGFLLLKSALTSEAFTHLSLTVVDHSRSRDFSRRDLWGTVPVEVIGKYEPDDVAALYGRIDVLVAPSVWPESFGLVTREARACGCWVVASDRGDIGGDVVDGINGHIVDVSDVRGLVAVLRRIDAAPLLYRAPPPDVGRMRTAEDQADDLAALYRSLLDRHRPTAEAEPAEPTEDRRPFRPASASVAEGTAAS